MLELFVEFCTIHCTLEVNHSECERSLTNMRIAVNKVVMPFAFLLDLDGLQSAWRLGIPG